MTVQGPAREHQEGWWYGPLDVPPPPTPSRTKTVKGVQLYEVVLENDRSVWVSIPEDERKTC